MRFLALLAVFLAAPLFGQNFVVDSKIEALMAKGIVSVAVVSTRRLGGDTRTNNGASYDTPPAPPPPSPPPLFGSVAAWVLCCWQAGYTCFAALTRRFGHHGI